MLGCMHQELLQLLHVDLQMDWKQPAETTAPNLIQTSSILITRPSLLSTGDPTIGTLRSKPRRPRCCAISVTLVVSSSGNHSKLTRRYNLVACSLSTILESARDSTMSLGWFRRIQSAVTPGNRPKSSKIYLLLGGVLFWFIFAWSAWGVLLWQHVQPRWKVLSFKLMFILPGPRLQAHLQLDLETSCNYNHNHYYNFMSTDLRIKQCGNVYGRILQNSWFSARIIGSILIQAFALMRCSFLSIFHLVLFPGTLLLIFGLYRKANHKLPWPIKAQSLTWHTILRLSGNETQFINSSNMLKAGFVHRMKNASSMQVSHRK